MTSKSKEEDARADAFIKAYEHGLEHNAPRSNAELAELKFMLAAGPDPALPPKLTEEESAKAKAFKEAAARDAAAHKAAAKA